MRHVRTIAGALVVAAFAVACGAGGEGRGDPTATSPKPGDQQADTRRNFDLVAQEMLERALAAAQQWFQANGSYDGADSSPTGLVTLEPGLCYVGEGTLSTTSQAFCVSGEGETAVSVYALGDTWSAAARSRSGRCFTIKNVAGTTTYGGGDPCAATGALISATKTEFSEPVG
ncbi:MAG: hypothetical protein HY658_00995 [Actinobacteria bacterium]|nr:hypothetical protein [Actinomycetota bacterium]